MPGTVTFLFTDIEGSTQLWEDEPGKMRPALARHDALVRAAVVSNGGMVVKMTGDGVYAAFDRPVRALDAAVAIQRAFADPGTTDGLVLRVRCGLHLGEVEQRDDDYFGGPVNRASRIMGAAHGGQILLSKAVVDQIRERLPPPCIVRDLGRVRLKDLAQPEHVYQLVHPQLRQDFPALRSLETAPNNLPQQISSFIGRGRELAEVKRLLAQSRLLTLVGIGGIGKTRLHAAGGGGLDRCVSRRRVAGRAGLDRRPVAGAELGGAGAERAGARGHAAHADALQSSQVAAPAAGARQLRAPDRRLRRSRRIAARDGAGLAHPREQPRAAAGRRRAELPGAAAVAARAGRGPRSAAARGGRADVRRARPLAGARVRPDASGRRLRSRRSARTSTASRSRWNSRPAAFSRCRSKRSTSV